LDLAKMVAEKRFRSDLYYRLNVFPIVIPALRDRREDIPLLVRHFMQKHAHRMKRRVETIPASELQAMTEYDWPGNVRELANVIERAIITARAGEFRFDLPLPPDRDDTARSSAALLALGPGVILSAAEMRQQERQNIAAALRRTQGKVYGPEGAARLLGMKPTTLLSRLSKLELKPLRHLRVAHE
jgi:formate hydrogenlyase transcriptional activator